ncbi:NADPH2:quinone reductase [Thermosporothrix hazakensis]|jgi:NADPH2:quinone reductase|uniref:NADPH2:quinone reductase n=1 Tax=Thermosporothrix hazakensis TaxID=644383 RepID=A0A326UBG0_THEHA|nr:zinc-binding dehydrogenase [Thermosporothrix hazakensis]PZW34342.1 NADPH2:quinone reductase [Thermosporothrix hazakensis]GCE46109.1 NADPH:quinone reductase [Thermosporothrix hazakensis]
MKAIAINAFGGPEVLQLQEMPKPVPGPGEVAIRVAYAGVNFAESMLRRGGHHTVHLPTIPGLEVSGHIAALGKGVEGLRVGQPVAAFTREGGYAEVAIAQAALTFPLDTLSKSIDLATAAGFPTIVPTAHDLLVRVARLQQGESVLIHAAAGGVGTLAGQIARLLGAGRVIGTVSTQEKARYAAQFGYDTVLLRDNFVQQVQELTQGRGVDIVLDSIGEPVRSQSLAVLAPLGRLVIFGGANEDVKKALDLPKMPGNMLAENKAIMGYSIGILGSSAPALLQETAARTLEWLAQERIRIDITEILPLKEVATAHARLESRASTGKYILRVNG